MRRSSTQAKKRRRDSRFPGRLVGARVLGLTALAVALAVLSLAPAQVIHRNGFEIRNPAWSRGAADATFKETAHDITDQTAHSPDRSEHIQLTAEMGNYIYYTYPLGRAPLVEELNISIWVKANRPGPQLMARLVLPHERKTDDINEPVSVLLRGDQYQLVGRWERLELRNPGKLAKEQQRLLQLEMKREVNFADAYIDQLVLNLYSGPGLTEVWLDDLEAGPVFEEPPAQPEATDKQTGKLTSLPTGPTARNGVVTLNLEHLEVNGKRFFPIGIRRSDTPLKTLRDAGFNCVWLEPTTTAAEIEEAVNLGFWLIPALPLDTGASPSSMGDALGRAVPPFLRGDAVLFWDLGGGRTLEEVPLITSAVQALRALDPGRPVAADVWDGFLQYARTLDLVGAHRWPLMTALELPQYREWLNQRRLLAQPRSSFQWTWVQTHLPDWYTSLVYDRKSDAGGQPMTSNDYTEPIGPEPEQIRLLTYTALAAGCQGLGFWSDRFLADSHQGRDRLLALALLNQELHMLEPLLLSVIEQPTWITTSVPEVQAAVVRTEKGLLVLPMWLGKGAQFVPGQSAVATLTMTVPQAPGGTQAWQITPGNVQSLPIERVIGGTKVTVPDFGLTTAIVFTSDNSPTGLLVRFQDHARRTRKLAAQWAHDLAKVEIDKVLKIEADLERAGHTLPDGKALQDDAQARLTASEEHWGHGDFRQSYQEAQRALRPLRIMMRAQWEQAIRGLDSPVASPFAVSFYTLPRHWDFMDRVRHATPGINVLPDGGFEADPRKEPSGWRPQQVTTDEVELLSWRIGIETDETKPLLAPQSSTSNDPTKQPASGNQPTAPLLAEPPKPAQLAPQEGQRCLKLQIKPKNPLLPPGALERTFLAVNSPVVHLPAGSLVRVSAWVRITQPIAASVDGALFYDSAGGEPMAVRLTGTTNGWKKYTLYRQVPSTGTISVTLALTGMGTVYFDDVRIEPLTPDTASVPATQWRKQDAVNAQNPKP
jgi:hypothetical protein